MIEKYKKRCREEIEKGGWHKLGIIEPSPDVLLWNKEVEIMYEDMDGYPQTCKAIYVRDSFSDYFKATNGPAVGSRMGNVIAYKELENVE